MTTAGVVTGSVAGAVGGVMATHSARRLASEQLAAAEADGGAPTTGLRRQNSAQSWQARLRRSWEPAWRTHGPLVGRDGQRAAKPEGQTPRHGRTADARRGWTRIIYPDASSVDLGKMPGTDQGGLAGLKDRVNTHFWKAFGNALLLSVFSAGVQISQGGGNNSGNGLNAQQTIAAGLGQQLGQLGQELARRNARIQPTLEIRPGYQFTVMVTKDVAIRPWRK